MPQKNDLIFAAVLCIPALTLGAYVAASYSLSPKILIATAAAVGLQFVLGLLLVARISSEGRIPEAAVSDDEDEIGEKLKALEEIGSLFGGSLAVRDMFRLLATRAGEIVPLRGAWFLPSGGDAGTSDLVSHGDVSNLSGDLIAALGAAAESGRSLVTDVAGSGDGRCAVAAFAVRRNDEVLGVAGLHVEAAGEMDPETPDLLEAIRTRIEPAIAGAVGRQRSAEGSLADPVTGLPNERAFRLVLENRMAEVKRSRGEASLGVLAIDLADFAEVNRLYGHSTGDRLLGYTGETLREQLREMDLLARASADEFLVVLANTDSASSDAVISRLKENTGGRFFKLPNGNGFPINLNAGAAFFGADGETSQELLSAARRRKDGQKPGKSNQVIQFPTKYSN